MNCPQCNQELNFSEEILKKFTNCPFCGKLLSLAGESHDSNASIETELKRIVNEFGGLEIFSEENSSRFAKALATIDVKFSDERDKLLVANIRRIPQKMYTVIDQPRNEQQKVIDSCSDDLMKFGLQKKLIEEIFSWLSNEMHFSVEKQKPIVVKRMEANITIGFPSYLAHGNVKNGSEGKFLGYQINTCRIKDTIWTAENMFLGDETFDDRRKAINDVSGTLFKGSCPFNVFKLPDNNWRIPTIGDFLELEEYIQSLGLSVGETLKSPNLWAGNGHKGADLFGFAAYPAYKGAGGITKISFWADSGVVGSNGESTYALVTLDGDSDNFHYEDVEKCRSKWGCLRFVMDAVAKSTSNANHIEKEKKFVELENEVAVSKAEPRQDRSLDVNTGSAAEISQDGPIDDQDIRHWKEDKFYKNVYSSQRFRNADLESKAEMRRVAKEEAKMIKALRRDAGLGGGCYITTAICEASGKPDDCYELTMMRKFRDEWLAKQPDGYYLINDYYETAPKIVAAIDGLRERRSIYDYLNCNFLKKCVDYAGRDLMADCKKCYMDMVRYCHNFLNE